MRGVLRILLYVITILLGVFLAAVNFRPELADMVASLAKTREGQWACGLASGTLLISPLVILLRWFQSIRRNREISYETDNGKISVNLMAIEEALTRAIEGEPEVKKAHVRVFEDRAKRSIIIDAVVTMWEVPNVTDRNRFCQRLLRRRFAELMPEQSQVDVNLHLHRLTERRLEPRPAKAKDHSPQVDPLISPSGIGPGPSAPSAVSESPVADALNREPDESELYMGPSYPVEDDDEDDLPKNRRR